MDIFNLSITSKYLGVISNLITENDLLNKININYANEDKYISWLTFKTDEGKILLISDRCLDIDISREFLHNINNNPIEIIIGSNKYLCRLPFNNEWNNLVINPDIYNNNNIGLNKYTICINSKCDNTIILRGYNDIYGLRTDIGNIDISNIGFRPVLEVI